MLKLNRSNSEPDGTSAHVRQVIHQAEKTASAAAGSAGGRVAETASRASDKVAVLGSKAGDTASSLTDRVGEKAGTAERNLKGSRRRLVTMLRPSRARAPRRKPGVAAEAILRAQLAKTSHDLAQESADLRVTVDSLGAVVKANRRAARRGRRRLVLGLLLGAALTYHFDAEHGRERRAATARRLQSLAGSGRAGASGLAGGA